MHRWVENISGAKKSEKVQIHICGTKGDLSQKRKILASEVRAYAKQYGSNYYETSAADSVNIKVMFLNVIYNGILKHKNNINSTAAGSDFNYTANSSPNNH